MSNKFKKFVIREKKSNIQHVKQKYWMDKYDYKPSYTLAHNNELVTYVNTMFETLLGKDGKLSMSKCESMNFRYDENIHDAFEFYCVNQEAIEYRYFMEV